MKPKHVDPANQGPAQPRRDPFADAVGAIQAGPVPVRWPNQGQGLLNQQDASIGGVTAGASALYSDRPAATSYAASTLTKRHDG